MAGIAVVLYGVVVVLVVGLAWGTAKRHDPLRIDARAQLAFRAARRRSLAAIALALGLLAIGIATAQLVPQWLGVGAALAPALACIGGLTLYAAIPPLRDDGAETRYAAPLTRRTPWNVAPRAALAVLGAAIVLLIALLVFTGATSSPDELGRFRAITFTAPLSSSTATPYPGWFYAVPLLIGTVLLAVAVWAALRRIATTASFPGEALEGLDAMWRARSAEIIVGLATAAVCLQLGGAALFAGTTMGVARLQPGTAASWQVLATGLTLLGIVSLLLSVVALTLAALRAFALPKRVIRSESQVGSPA